MQDAVLRLRRPDMNYNDYKKRFSASWYRYRKAGNDNDNDEASSTEEEEEELNEGEKEEELTPREKRIRAREAKKMNVDKE